MIPNPGNDKTPRKAFAAAGVVVILSGLHLVYLGFEARKTGEFIPGSWKIFPRSDTEAIVHGIVIASAGVLIVWAFVRHRK